MGRVGIGEGNGEGRGRAGGRRMARVGLVEGESGGVGEEKIEG